MFNKYRGQPQIKKINRSSDKDVLIRRPQPKTVVDEPKEDPSILSSFDDVSDIRVQSEEEKELIRQREEDEWFRLFKGEAESAPKSEFIMEKDVGANPSVMTAEVNAFPNQADGGIQSVEESETTIGELPEPAVLEGQETEIITEDSFSSDDTINDEMLIDEESFLGSKESSSPGSPDEQQEVYSSVSKEVAQKEMLEDSSVLKEKIESNPEEKEVFDEDLKNTEFPQDESSNKEPINNLKNEQATASAVDTSKEKLSENDDQVSESLATSLDTRIPTSIFEDTTEELDPSAEEDEKWIQDLLLDIQDKTQHEPSETASEDLTENSTEEELFPEIVDESSWYQSTPLVRTAALIVLEMTEGSEDDEENGIEGNVTALSTAGGAIEEPDFVARPEELLDPIDEQFEDDADEGVPVKQNSNRNHKKKRKNRR